VTSRAGPTGGEGIRVLLVEDDDTDARLAELALDDERVGAFTMRRAASLRRALEMLAVEPYDLVLLDLGLPDAGELDGVGALARIEDAPPIVVLTGRGEHDLAVAAIRAGAQDFVVKGEPDRNPLARAVGHALEREWAARRQRDRDQGYYEVMAEPAGTRCRPGCSTPPRCGRPPRRRSPRCSPATTRCWPPRGAGAGSTCRRT
jgi:DNA-binding NtrC family response regulator